MASLSLAACGTDSLVQNMTAVNGSNSTDNGTGDEASAPSEPVDEPEEEEQPAEQEEAVEQEEPEESFEAPETLDILLDDVSVMRAAYGEDEDHRMNLYLREAKYDGLESASLSYEAVCNEDPRLLVTLNTHVVSAGPAACNDETVLDLEPDWFLEGQNLLRFRSDTEEIYELADIALSFVYEDGTTEDMPADSILFRPEDAGEKEVDDLSIVSMTNTVTRKFSLNAQERLHDLHVSFDARNREGEVIVLLNGEELFSGLPKKEGNKLTLPHELLKGKNELVFIGLAEE